MFKNKSTLLLEFFYFIILILLVIFLNNCVSQGLDTWWHLKLGQIMSETRSIIREDSFSVLAQGKPFIAYQWLAQVLFFQLFDIGDFYLKTFALGIVLSTLFVLHKKILFALKDKLIHFAYFFMTAFVIGMRFEIRPHLFGIFFSAILIATLWDWIGDQKIKKLVIIPIIQVFWVNTHGSFMLSPFFIFIFACLFYLTKFGLLKGDLQINYSHKSLKQLFLLFLITFLVSLINPFGFEMLKKSFLMYFQDQYMRQNIVEWYSLIKVKWGFWTYIWLIFNLSTWGILYKYRKKISTIDLGIVILATYFPFSGIRYTPLSCILMLPVVVKFLKDKEIKKINFPVLLSLQVVITLLIGIYGYPLWFGVYRPKGLGLMYNNIPKGIIQHLKVNHYEGNMMNTYNHGAFITYFLSPKIKPIIDSRTEIYGEKLYLEHKNAFEHPDLFFPYLEKYNIDFIMVPNNQIHVRNILFKHPEWNFEKSDLGHDLFVRRKVAKIFERKFSKQENIQISQKKKRCLILSWSGNCEQTEDCQEECKMNIDQIAQELNLDSNLCLFFMSSCMKLQFACGNCRDFCAHYSDVYQTIDEPFKTKLFPSINPRLCPVAK
ncbi:MAG: hypothetical protein H6622_05380 [Halobacteriovoraceae bacterium]|nr:hypothetical protein [Halobacteriovoraceae bacterium]